MSKEKLVLVTCKRFPLQFWTREGTSDLKAITEVVERNTYQRPRKGFQILPGENWVDLGGNVGAFAVLAAHLGAKVESFEADPENYAILVKNLELNRVTDRVTAHQLAVTADHQKKAWLSVSEKNKNFWRNSIAKVWKGSRMVSVPCVHFRDVIRPQDCVKMDIEGSEMPILESLDYGTAKLVFEWSFDIDPDCDRFRAVAQRLEGLYQKLDYAPIPTEVRRWPGEWFPAAKMVWCSKD